ncbi:CLUMA_CG002959, isoform A [Clunio marinus]|uniref:CLUMA_CG002959, isoform A n=1 Tax=Clunio marinus TaxID=568069 RepID=A0A1J1HMB7_9DIPT|nr:CLUMA_CG002959, isoform A [Clunio marinus]
MGNLSGVSWKILLKWKIKVPREEKFIQSTKNIKIVTLSSLKLQHIASHCAMRRNQRVDTRRPFPLFYSIHGNNHIAISSKNNKLIAI